MTAINSYGSRHVEDQANHTGYMIFFESDPPPTPEPHEYPFTEYDADRQYWDYRRCLREERRRRWVFENYHELGLDRDLTCIG
jgi:hypothetical protein